MFSCSEILQSHTNINLIIFNKKGVIVDLQNMRKQGAKMEKLVFNFADFLVGKNDICKMPKSQLFFSD